MGRDDYKSLWGFDCSCELCGNTDIESSTEIEKHRILYWQQYKLGAVYSANPRYSEMTLKLCEDLLLLQDKAKCFSVRDQLNFGFAGLEATLELWNKLSLSCLREKIMYFTELIEKALSICEGPDFLGT